MVADAGLLDTAGKGFWILLEDRDEWIDRVTVIGEVVNGWDAVEKLHEEGGKVVRATVVRRREHERYESTALDARLPRD